MNEGRIADRLAHVAAARLEAERRYNDALTRLDRALPAQLGVPAPPPAFDDQLLPSINDRRDILPAGSPVQAAGWRGRLAAFVWRLVGPPLEGQRAFNAVLVEHLNRNAAGHHDARRALAETAVALRAHAEALAAFDSLLLQFLQQITPFVETKGRELANTLAEVRTIAELSQRASLMAKREVQRLAGQRPASDTPPAPGPASSVTARASDSYKYVGFEDCFRGSEAEIRGRMADYVGYFAGASDVLDVGCGRGEFLGLLKEAGIAARGLDLNHEMVEVCRARGLEATEGDALAYLQGLAEGSLGGLFAAQVVEHFEPGYLAEWLDTAARTLRPGSRIVLETINPACWVAFFESYIRDLTHVRPLHPDTLKFLLLSSGFSHVEVIFRSPVPESGRLQPIAVPQVPPGTPDDAPVRQLAAWARTLNDNVERLNHRMFTHLDYAAIGTRA